MKLTRGEKILNIVIFVGILFLYFVVGFSSYIVSGVVLLVVIIWTIYLNRITKIRREQERKRNQEKANEYKNRIY
jgi:predicted membrane protein